MATIFQMPGAFPPEAAALIARRLLNKHSAHEIAEAVEVLIDVLDLIGGDPDVELNGDENDDPGDLKDAAYTEWETRGRHKLAGGLSEMAPGPAGWSEDAEEDDPSGIFDEDGINTMLAFATGYGPGCAISDPDCEHDGREIDDDGM